MYKDIEILTTDFEDKYLLRLHNKTMYVGFVVKDIVAFLKKGKHSVEIQAALSDKYDSSIGIEVIEGIIEHKVNPFVTRNEATSFKKIARLFNPSVISTPRWILCAFGREVFYGTGLFLLIANSYFFYQSAHFRHESALTNAIAYLLLFFVLIIHETGHWLAAKRYGITVKEIGIGWYFFLPVLYVDLNESWRLENKKRIIINLSGIYLQLICGMLLLGLSLFFPFWESMFMMVFLMNFSIVILNFNPFLKFDGYWVLSDLLDIRDLNAKSNTIIRNAFGFKRQAENSAVVVYAILKTLFVLFIVLSFVEFFRTSLFQLYVTKKVEVSSFFAMGFLMLFFFRVLKSKIRKSK